MALKIIRDRELYNSPWKSIGSKIISGPLSVPNFAINMDWGSSSSTIRWMDVFVEARVIAST